MTSATVLTVLGACLVLKAIAAPTIPISNENSTSLNLDSSLLGLGLEHNT